MKTAVLEAPAQQAWQVHYRGLLLNPLIWSLGVLPVKFSRKPRTAGLSSAAKLRRQLFLESLEQRDLMTTINLDITSPTYVENGAVVEISPTATVGDGGTDGTFENGTLLVEFTANEQTGDELGVIAEGTGTGQFSIDGSNNILFEGNIFGTVASSGSDLQFTFDSNASVATVQALVQHIGFRNTGDDPTANVRTVSFTLSDPDGTAPTSASATIDVNVTPVNDPPVASDSDFSINEDTPYTFQLSDFPFTDAEGDSLASITISNLSVTGTFQLNGSDVTNDQVIDVADISNLVYTPSTNQSGSNLLSFDFTANDSSTGVTTGHINVSVDAVNDVPVATGNTIAIDEDVSHTFQVSEFLFTDTEDDALVSIVITNLSLGNGTLTLNGNAVSNDDVITAAEIPTLVFTPASDESGTPYATFSYTVNDAGTGTVSAAFVINVNAVNDPPVASASAVTTQEEQAYTFQVSDFQFTDAEGNDLTAVEIGNQLLGGGTLTLNGVTVTNGTVVTRSQIESGLLVFAPSMDQTGSPAATFDFTVDDADAGVTSATMSITVTNINDAPVVSLPNEAVNYVIDGAPVIVSPNGTVTDVDSANFNGGSLVVTIISNIDTDDILSIATTASISVSGTDVLFNGTQIGTFTGGSSGNPLQIDLNTSATPEAVTALIESITFSNSNSSPSTQPRSIQFAVTDDATGLGTDVKQVTLSVFNAAPVLTLSAEDVTYTEKDAAVVITNGATLTDSDSPNFDGGNLVVAVTTNGTASDRLEIRNQGSGTGEISVNSGIVSYEGTAIGTFTIGSGTVPMTVSFNSSATLEAFQALLRNITFRVSSNAPSTALRTITFTITDNGEVNAETATASKNVMVAAVNDAPTVTLSSEVVNFQIGGSPVVVVATATVTDVDSTNFDTGSLVVSITSGNVANDSLTIRDQGAGTDTIDVVGNSIEFNGTSIGTFSGGDGLNALQIQLNSSATPAAVKALLQNILFSNSDSTPATLARTISFALNDGDGSTTTTTKDITLSAANAAPTITLSQESVNYNSGGAAVQIVTTATVTDSDSPNFNGGNATITITANGESTDRLEFLTSGTVTTSSNNVLVDGVTIGTFAGGTGTAPLVITFNSSATLARINTLLQNIGYRSTSSTPSTTARTIEFSVTDNGDVNQQTATASKSVTVTQTNVAPVFSPSSEAVTFTQGGSAVFLSATGTVTDSDSANFDGGTLTVTISSNGTVNDLLAISSVGTGTGQISVSGNAISYEGTQIGTFAGGTGTTALVITFNANATVDAVTALTRRLTFNNNSTNPSTATRSVQFVLSDGDGGTDSARTKVVSVVSTVNAAPVVSLSPGSVSYTENAAAVLIGSTSTVTDSDSTNFDGGVLTITITANGTSDDRLAILLQGSSSRPIDVDGINVTYNGTTIGTVAGGTGTTPLTITLNAAATPEAVQALLRSINYATISQTPSTATRTISVTLTDGDGGTSTAATTTISVVSVNDAPINTVPSAQTSANGANIVFSTANGNAISVSDLDAGTASMLVTLSVTSGSLTLSQTTGLTFTTGNGTANGTMTFTGSITNINAALQGMTFTPASSAAGTSTLTLTTNDQGNTGGAAQSDTDTVQITITNTASGTSNFAGTVFVDSNGNGKKDDGEYGIKGVTVTLTGLGANAGTTQTTTTNANGVYRFQNIAAGQYRITESQPVNFTNGKTAGPSGSTVDGDSVTVTVGAGQTVNSITFGETGLAPKYITLDSFLSSTDHAAIIQSAAQGTGSSSQSLRLSANQTASPGASATQLTLAQARQAVRIAAKQWAKTDTSGTEQLSKVRVRVADLSGDQLAVTDGLMVTFDINAAEQGWFVDPTPGRDEEFVTRNGQLVARSGDAVNHVDLLTVAAHELGHVLGMEDLYSAADKHDLMASMLVAGIRKRPNS